MSLKKNTHCGKNKLTGQYETVKNSIKEKTAERDAIKNDFSVLRISAKIERLLSAGVVHSRRTSYQ